MPVDLAPPIARRRTVGLPRTVAALALMYLANRAQSLACALAGAAERIAKRR